MLQILDSHLEYSAYDSCGAVKAKNTILSDLNDVPTDRRTVAQVDGQVVWVEWGEKAGRVGRKRMEEGGGGGGRWEQKEGRRQHNNSTFSQN